MWLYPAIVGGGILGVVAERLLQFNDALKVKNFTVVKISCFNCFNFSNNPCKGIGAPDVYHM